MLSLTLGLLTIEFLDELVFGAREASWPLIRDDLQLSYTQIGVLLSLPTIIGNITELLIGILGDVWKRRALILGGGVAYALALLLTSFGHSFTLLLIAFVLINPASGAFVGLSQATLMDADPARREQNMARWTLAGSVGLLSGPIALSAAVALGIGWRGTFFVLALLTVILLRAVWRMPFVTAPSGAEQEDRLELKDGARDALRALKSGKIVRWSTLLVFSDLMLDVLNGYLALYFVDKVGVSNAQAGLAVVVWAGVGLAGDFLLIKLLERVRGLRYLWHSALIVSLLFPAFLLVQGYAIKLVILGLLGFSNAGWYSILKAQLFASLPGRSGTVMAIDSLFGLVGGLTPLALGLVADSYGLGATMWFLLAGPIALLIGIAKER